MGPPPNQNVLLWIVVFSSFGIVGGVMSVLVWFLKRLLAKYDKRLNDQRRALNELKKDLRDEIDGVDSDMGRMNHQLLGKIEENRDRREEHFAREERVKQIKKDVRQSVRRYRDDIGSQIETLITLIEEQ